MTLQLLHSEFPYLLGKFDFLFYQCRKPANVVVVGVTSSSCFGLTGLFTIWRRLGRRPIPTWSILAPSCSYRRHKVGPHLQKSCRVLLYTDKKENKIFLIYKDIHNRAVAKSYMTNGLLIYGEIFAHFPIY
jgi:hypothetical protein